MWQEDDGDYHLIEDSTAGHRTCGRRMVKIIISSRRRKTELGEEGILWSDTIGQAEPDYRRTQYEGEVIVRVNWPAVQCSKYNTV